MLLLLLLLLLLHEMLRGVQGECFHCPCGCSLRMTKAARRCTSIAPASWSPWMRCTSFWVGMQVCACEAVGRPAGEGVLLAFPRVEGRGVAPRVYAWPRTCRRRCLARRSSLWLLLLLLLPPFAWPDRLFNVLAAVPIAAFASAQAQVTTAASRAVLHCCVQSADYFRAKVRPLKRCHWCHWRAGSATPKLQCSCVVRLPRVHAAFLAPPASFAFCVVTMVREPACRMWFLGCSSGWPCPTLLLRTRL